MTTLFDKKPQEVIQKAADGLKKEIAMPVWAKFVKTGHAKQRPPEDQDWWYKRAASILRKIYRHGPIGTNKLKKKYGSKKNRGHKPEMYAEGSGKIIRVILQQLEQKQLIKQETKGTHKGRVITPKGKSFLDKIK
ncbi:MAG: 30S ribosomal protein S19e, partial [Candidatus Woesearchaeota archaeon]|nr:30S ribosomal protein S19e [Candidatus Woesearchaeota archaeon]